MQHAQQQGTLLCVRRGNWLAMILVTHSSTTNCHPFCSLCSRL